MNGAIYARVSTDEQARPGLASIPHQIEICQKLAKGDSVHIVDTITDDETGQTLDRPGLQQLLTHIEAYKFLYVYDTTRLGRTRKVLTTIRDELKKAGITLRLVHGDTSDMDEESAIIFEGLQDSMAEAEIKKFVRRSKLGREGRAKRGFMTGKVPIGWMAIKDTNGSAIDYQHDPTYDQFFADLEEIFLSGAPSSQFPKKLLARGHVSPITGRMHAASSLRYILRNPINRGDLVFGWTSREKKDQVVYANTYPSRWNKPDLILAELKRREQLKGGARKQIRRFRGVLVCDRCGWKMSGCKRFYTKKDGSRVEWIQYRCTKHVDYQKGTWHEDCQNNNIQEKVVIEQLSTWFRKMADPKVLDDIILEMLPNNHDPEKLKRIEGRLSEIDRILAGLVDRIAQVPDAAVPDVHSRMDDLSRERTDLEEQLQLLQEEMDKSIDAETYKEILLEAANNIDDLLANTKSHEVQAGLNQLFPDGIPVRDGEIML